MFMRHVHISEKVIKNEIYEATSELIGLGFSPSEALNAVMIVSNRCFGRKFHRSKAPLNVNESEFIPMEPMDQDTLPNERSVQEMAERVEAQGLSAEAHVIFTRSKDGAVITHASDSTTKKMLGNLMFLASISIKKPHYLFPQYQLLESQKKT